MFCLTEKLPQWIECGGDRYEIFSDFRIWMRFEEILFSGGLLWEEKLTRIFTLCYPKRLPPTIDEALNGLVWFYCGGKKDSMKQFGTKNRIGGRLYDWKTDAQWIYAAFLSQYHIDLTCENLHWWKFLALFRALDSNCRICQIMQYRAMDLSAITDSKSKAYYRKMKRLYRLPERKSKEETEQELAEIMAQMMG